MKKIIHPCDVPMWNGKKYPMFCEIEFTNRVLSISGVIGPLKSGNAIGGCGQINMEFDHVNKAHNDSRYEHLIKASELRFAPGWDKTKWYKFLEAWHDWHLNDLHAECEHQEVLGWTYETHKGQSCPTCGYEIGTAWTRREVPQDVVDFLFSLPDTDRVPNWV